MMLPTFGKQLFVVLFLLISITNRFLCTVHFTTMMFFARRPRRSPFTVVWQKRQSLCVPLSTTNYDEEAHGHCLPVEALVGRRHR